MATITKRQLSGSTDGLSIAIAATATPGTTLHTGATATGTIDEIWLYVFNTATADRQVTIEWGGVATSNTIIDTITAQDGLWKMADGLNLGGAATALIIRAFATATGGINAQGYVNRIA